MLSSHSLIYSGASEYQFPGLFLFRKVRKNSAKREHRLFTFSVNDLALNNYNKASQNGLWLGDLRFYHYSIGT